VLGLVGLPTLGTPPKCSRRFRYEVNAGSQDFADKQTGHRLSRAEEVFLLTDTCHGRDFRLIDSIQPLGI